MADFQERPARLKVVNRRDDKGHASHDADAGFAQELFDSCCQPQCQSNQEDRNADRSAFACLILLDRKLRFGCEAGQQARKGVPQSFI
ncbi:hypothetical protein [Bradyrhizobium sp. USDA 10063]